MESRLQAVPPRWRWQRASTSILGFARTSPLPARLLAGGAMAPQVGTRTPVAGGPTRRRPKNGPLTETLVPPYVINQTLVQGWIWAFQVKS